VHGNKLLPYREGSVIASFTIMLHHMRMLQTFFLVPTNWRIHALQRPPNKNTRENNRLLRAQILPKTTLQRNSNPWRNLDTVTRRK